MACSMGTQPFQGLRLVQTSKPVHQNFLNSDGFEDCLVWETDKLEHYDSMYNTAARLFLTL